jgi:hypothetical protein
MQIIQTIDDLHHHEDGEQVAAERTHRLTLDGKDTELDLTAEHYKELDELLARYFAAGRKPQGPPRAPKTGAGKRPTDYNAGMREYADAHGINYRAAKSGKPYYSAKLKRAYAAHLAVLP